MEVLRFKENIFKANNFLVIDNFSAVLIDASVPVFEIENALKENNASLKAVFLTHSHFDHIMNLDNIVDYFKIPVYLHENGLESLYDEVKNESGSEHPLIINTKENINLFSKNFEELDISGIKVKVYYTPGHSNCSVCYEIGDFLFTGDTIFKGIIGRSDLWNSSPIDQQKTLKKLKEFPPKKLYFSGHGVHFDHNYLIRTIEKFLI